MTAPAIPRTQAEFEEAMHDLPRVNQMLSDGSWADFMKGYAQAVAKTDEALLQQTREQTQAVLAQMVRDGELDGSKLTFTGHPSGYDSPETRVQALRSTRTKHGLYDADAPGAKANGVFKRFPDFLRAMSPKVQNYRDYQELTAALGKIVEVQNSFGTNVPSDGGFLVPEEFRSDLLMLTLESEIVAPRATVIPMSTQRTLIPTVDSTSNATSVYGGIVCYWVDEATAPTESSARFGQVVLDAKKLMAYCTAPNELVADAPAFGAFLNAALPKAMGFERDYRYIQGTGAGEPLGWVNCPASVAVTAVTAQGASTIVVENLASMYSRMLPSSLNNAVWVASIDTFPQLATMALSVGTGGAPVFLTNGGVADAPPMTIYGRPVIFTEKTPALGSLGDISFVDLSFYLIGDRQAAQASASQDFLFSSDRTAYKIVTRTDGRPWLQSAITPKNGSSATLSPFVHLSGTRT